MSSGLDDFLTDDTRRTFVAAIARRSLTLADPVGRRTGELFVSLLNGELKTTSSSPIDYL
jgi:hypothetical protein